MSLCGLALQVKKPVSGKITLQVPVLVPDPRHPIRNSKGMVKGFHSKQVGVATVKDFPVIQAMAFGTLGYMNGSKAW